MPESEQLYVFDKQTERSFRTNVRNVAAENAFYDVSLPEGKLSAETALSELETAAASIIREIVNQKSVGFLSPEQRLQLALFTAVQMVRVKQQVHMMAEMTEMIRKRFGNLPGMPAAENSMEYQRVAMVNNLKVANDLVPHLLDKALILFRAHPKAHFYVSDNPVTMNNKCRNPYRGTLGLTVLGIEVYLPITPELTLGFYCMSHVEGWMRSKIQFNILKSARAEFPDELKGKDALFDTIIQAAESGRALEVSESVTHFQNELQIWNSSRFVFGRRPDFDLVRDTIRRHASCKTGPKVTS